jgi:hypothetical protein
MTFLLITDSVFTGRSLKAELQARGHKVFWTFELESLPVNGRIRVSVSIKGRRVPLLSVSGLDAALLGNEFDADFGHAQIIDEFAKVGLRAFEFAPSCTNADDLLEDGLGAACNWEEVTVRLDEILAELA